MMKLNMSLSKGNKKTKGWKIREKKLIMVGNMYRQMVQRIKLQSLKYQRGWKAAECVSIPLLNTKGCCVSQRPLVGRHGFGRSWLKAMWTDA